MIAPIFLHLIIFKMNHFSIEQKRAMVFQLAGKDINSCFLIADLIGIDTSDFNINQNINWELYDEVERLVIVEQLVPEEKLDEVLNQFNIK